MMLYLSLEHLINHTRKKHKRKKNIQRKVYAITMQQAKYDDCAGPLFLQYRDRTKKVACLQNTLQKQTAWNFVGGYSFSKQNLNLNRVKHTEALF